MRQRRASTKPKSLMLVTMRLLEGKDLVAISTATSIPSHWIAKFKNGTWDNPSVNRVQEIYEHITGTKLLKD